MNKKALTNAFGYLDQIQKGGGVNMFGAGPHLTAAFGYDKYEARKILKGWMDTYDGSSTAAERAVKALPKLK